LKGDDPIYQLTED